MPAVHNDRMFSRARRRLTLPAAVALASALVLGGCSGGGGDDDPESTDSSATSSGGATSSDTAYLNVPDGVELTAQGSELDFGDTATVAFEPRQDRVAALDLTVQSIEKASFKMFVGWKLDDDTLSTTPYFVQVKIKNVGETDLGGDRIPVYGVDGDNKLIEYSTFSSSFKPCPSPFFPKKFKGGDTLKTCLVYLAPHKGKLTAASFRPVEEFNPIIWTGDISPVDTGGKKGDKKSGGKQGDKKGDKKKG
jgi:hypothetical protein